VAVTGGGKTNTERCLVFADWERVQARLVENWGNDLSPGGVELRPMAGQFAVTQYGIDPEGTLQFWKNLWLLMESRLIGMGDKGINYFIPSEGDPLVYAYLDEARLLKLPQFNQVRGEIYAYMSAVLTNGRKAGVVIRAFTQTAKLENFSPRDDFPIVKPGRLRYRRHVDMVVGEGAWASGMRSELLDPEVPGIYYAETEGINAVDQMRCGDVPFQIIKKLQEAPVSFLDPCWSIHEPSAVERGQGAPVEVPVSEAPRLFVMPPR
jgi:hypothetical protein